MNNGTQRRQGMGHHTYATADAKIAATSLQMAQSQANSQSMIVPSGRDRSRAGSRNPNSRTNSHNQGERNGQIQISSSANHDNFTLYDRENVTDSRRWTSMNIGQGAHCFAGDDNNNLHVQVNAQRQKKDQRVWDKLSVGKNSHAYLGDRNFLPTQINNQASGNLLMMGARNGFEHGSETPRYRTRISVMDHRSMEFDTEG